MSTTETKSFLFRLRNGQGGNVVVYIMIFMIGWVAFFTIKDWIKSTKEARYQKVERENASPVYPNDIYSNPYQVSR